MGAFSEDPQLIGSDYVGLELALKVDFLTPTSGLLELISAVSPSKASKVRSPFFLSALSEVQYPMGLYFYCTGRLLPEKIEKFSLVLKRRPQTAPPPEVVRSTKSMGGYAEAVRKVVTAMEGLEEDWTATLDCFLADKKIAALRPRADPNIPGLTLTQEEVTFVGRDEPKPTITVKFSSSGEESGRGFTIKSRLRLRITPNYVEDATSRLINLTSPLFVKQ